MKTLTGYLRESHLAEPRVRDFQVFGDYAVGEDDGCVYQVVSREDAISFLIYDTDDENISFNFAEDDMKYELISEGELDELFIDAITIFENKDVYIKKIDFHERTLYRVYYQNPTGTHISNDLWDNIDLTDYEL
jgi:hypothetical protein